MLLRRWLWTRSLVVLALALYAESLFRVLEVYPIEKFMPASQASTPENARTQPALIKRVIKYAEAMPNARGTDPAWIGDRPTPQPDPPPLPPDRMELYERAIGIRIGLYSRAMFTYNLNFLRKDVCNNGPSKHMLNGWAGPFHVFTPSDDRVDPIYRLPLYHSLPTGGRSNSFGWKGSELPLNKLAGTIRIGFLGDSTTHGFWGAPSYPEYVKEWLNRWAKDRGHDFRFDVFNTSRLAGNSSAISNSVSEEVVQLEPDIVVYYGGGGELGMTTYVKTPKFDAKKAMKAELERLEQSGLDEPEYSDLWNLDSSALLRRVSASVTQSQGDGLREVEKPANQFVLPKNFDETNPNVNEDSLPPYLKRWHGNLRKIRQELDKINADFVMSSFVWMVTPELVLDPKNDKPLWRHLNRWPNTYAHFYRTAELNNRAFENMSKDLGIEFIDIAASMPRDPALFADEGHDFGAGTRLKAWIVMQGLIPIILNRVEQGKLPRPDRVWLESHPNVKPDRLIEDPCK